ncbi:MAG: YcxB family protein [Caulobacteraceae bacterium]|nr:YcxB family protein [Caulobacteraceae bacterium]
MEIAGDLRIGEGAAMGPFIRKRLLGRRRFVLPGVWAGLAAGGILAVMAAARWSSAGKPALFLWVALVWLTIAIYPRWCRSAIRHAWVARGTPDPTPTVFRVADDGLLMKCPGWTATLPWTAISEINRDGPYWIIFAEGAAYILPRRFFSRPGDEQTFITICHERLRPDAVARSVGVPA